MVRLVFLGRLADVAGAGEMTVASGGLRAVIARLPAPLTEAVTAPRIRIAVNGAVLAPEVFVDVSDGDEVAFLPPVSGG